MRVEYGPVFELVATAIASLGVGHGDHYDVGQAWFDRLASDAPNAAAGMRDFAGGSARIWDHVLGFVLDSGPPFEAATVCAHLRDRSPDGVLLDLIGRRNRPVQRAVGQELIERAATGDPAAQRSFMRLAWPQEAAWQGGLRQLFDQPAGETRDQLVDLMVTLDQEIRPGFLDPVLAALERDAAAKRASTRNLDALALIRLALDTGYVPTADVEEVVLVPSFVVRPYFHSAEHADQMMFLYPLPDRAAESIGAGPPERLVKLTSALGDHVRLEILAALREQELTMKELSERLDIPRSRLRHHLGVLRLAGLIRPVQTDAGLSSYEFRREVVGDVSDLLGRYLGS